ncbi:MAG: hypothetical protein ABFS35_10965 [Bacteroidota bacterium]
MSETKIPIFPQGSFSEEYYRMLARIILDPEFRDNAFVAQKAKRMKQFAADATYNLTDADIDALNKIQYSKIAKEPVDDLLSVANMGIVRPVPVFSKIDPTKK